MQQFEHAYDPSTDSTPCSFDLTIPPAGRHVENPILSDCPPPKLRAFLAKLGRRIAAHQKSLRRLTESKSPAIDEELVRLTTDAANVAERLDYPAEVWPSAPLKRLSPQGSLNYIRDKLRPFVRELLVKSGCRKRRDSSALRRRRDSDTEKPGEARKWLFGWSEILAAIGIKGKNIRTRQIIALNRHYDGPIRQGRQGAQPVVDHDDLLRWWNSLAEMHDECSARQRDEAATVSARHQHGRGAEVAPEISGSVKRRRRPA
jgi:hypothetical protein